MGQGILKPRFLNLDKDSRIIQTNEMLAAYNVRVTTDGGDSGVVKNIKGNSASSTTILMTSTQYGSLVITLPL